MDFIFTIAFLYYIGYNAIRYGGNIMQNFILFMAKNAKAPANGAQQGGGDWTIMLIYIAVIGLAMYFMMIRPQKKRQKQEEKLRNSLQVGDQIVTIGGINGRIVAVKEDSIIIETGPTRSQMQFSKWSVQENKTVHDEEESK